MPAGKLGGVGEQASAAVTRKAGIQPDSAPAAASLAAPPRNERRCKPARSVFSVTASAVEAVFSFSVVGCAIIAILKIIEFIGWLALGARFPVDRAIAR
jgi:hypothetical protein